ncbi:hypothetical protein BS47DRAFT_909503 [Hydnum rufescens UP504]|uniref:Uncharacterized protein n=1 Tax=Hydnum rufescens UP504 TaxID=1448309 RepID=A0A9P6AXU8_9AGAM|nr:hypothetical protein BS47DRAFT_909503 [Hydnum rufescens UP504]
MGDQHRRSHRVVIPYPAALQHRKDAWDKGVSFMKNRETSANKTRKAPHKDEQSAYNNRHGHSSKGIYHPFFSYPLPPRLGPSSFHIICFFIDFDSLNKSLRLLLSLILSLLHSLLHSLFLHIFSLFW